jgi:hypothetical protein
VSRAQVRVPTPCLRIADKVLSYTGSRLQHAGLVLYSHVVARDPDLDRWIEESKRRLPPPPPPELTGEDVATVVRHFRGVLNGERSGTFTATDEEGRMFIHVYAEVTS